MKGFCLVPGLNRLKFMCSPANASFTSRVYRVVCFEQRITSKLHGAPKYHDWLPASAYADTGERSGFVRSVFLSEGGWTRSRKIVGGSDNSGLDSPCPAEVVPRGELTESAAALAKMQGVLPHMPVTTPAEVKKFNNDFMKFLGGGRQSALDFDKFVPDWNQSVSDMEESKTEVTTFFRKTAGHLQTYWKMLLHASFLSFGDHQS